MKRKRKVRTPGQEKVAEVMHEFKEGELHSGKSGIIVTNPKQAIAIALSEAKELEEEMAEIGLSYKTLTFFKKVKTCSKSSVKESIF